MSTNNEDKLILGGHEFTSRFILGSGKFSLDLVKACIEKADAQIIAITPISPHTLTSRPIVVSADDVVTVEVKPSREDTPFTVSADGQNNFTLTGQNVVQIRRADVCTTIIKTKPQSFYDVLRHKLK